MCTLNKQGLDSVALNKKKVHSLAEAFIGHYLNYIVIVRVYLLKYPFSDCLLK